MRSETVDGTEANETNTANVLKGAPEESEKRYRVLNTASIDPSHW